uniref:Uncharacterized protein n=1 Tax=Ciona savignyi TaxID=51511 RepID=H2Z9S3_CIOSA
MWVVEGKRSLNLVRPATRALFEGTVEYPLL